MNADDLADYVDRLERAAIELERLRMTNAVRSDVESYNESLRLQGKRDGVLQARDYLRSYVAAAVDPETEMVAAIEAAPRPAVDGWGDAWLRVRIDRNGDLHARYYDDMGSRYPAPLSLNEQDVQDDLRRDLLGPEVTP